MRGTWGERPGGDSTTIQPNEESSDPGGHITICQPDDRKSCAACCGVYNVPIATRPHLLARMKERTLCFQETQRSIESIAGFEAFVRTAEADAPLDEVIHVCGYAGFVDRAFRRVGCMLHPLAPGNNGIDYRGLCHYGSMACKTFFCAAWEDLPLSSLRLVCDAVDDWHLYGLVITDVNFVSTLLSFLEESLKCRMDPEIIRMGEAKIILQKMLSWKNSWPFGTSSLRRRSPYYVRRQVRSNRRTAQGVLDQLMASINFTYDVGDSMDGGIELIHQTTADFVRAYRLQETIQASNVK